MVITRTPFRISFFGGGTDYPVWYKQHGGCVISTTINKYCYITTSFLPPFFNYKYRIRYTQNEEVDHTSQINHSSVRECLRFMRIKNGIEMIHTNDVPSMSGLGSSSAFTVGLLHSLHQLFTIPIKKNDLAKFAIEVEQNRIKETVGSQDQVAASHGGLNKITFKKNGEIIVEPLAMSGLKKRELEKNLLLFFTGYQRHAAVVAKEIVKNSKKKSQELMKISRLTEEAFQVLTSRKDNLKEVGRLLDETWQVKRSLADAVTNDAIDEIYDEGLKAGAMGGKILGAGGGGFILFFVEPGKQEAVIKRLKKLINVPFRFESEGSKVIYNNILST